MSDFIEKDIPVEHIDEPREAMRSDIPRDEVFELATDIKKNGLINPITVRPVGERFEVVAGHRRLLAHRYGGMPLIRCVVRQLDDDEAFAIMTSENLKRENVNPVDEAIHVGRLMSRHNDDTHKVAEIVGRSPTWVEQRVAIGKLPEELRVALLLGKITIGAALALQKITNDNDRMACLEMAMSQGASIVMVNYWVTQWELGLFGEALMAKISDPDDPGRERQVIMLRCSLDGKQYPATDFVSVLICRANVGYLDAMREAIKNGAFAVPVAPDENIVLAGSVDAKGGGDI